jgi:hypothetical protein
MAVSILTAGLFLVMGEPSRFAQRECQSGTPESGSDGASPYRSAFHFLPLTSHFSLFTVTRVVASTPVQPIGHLRRLLAAVGICEIGSP